MQKGPSAPPLPPVVRAGTVAMVGRSNVGKSTLMNALLGEALAIVSATPQTTRNRVLGVLRHGDAQIGLLDTPGLHKARNQLGKLMNTTAHAAIDEADVVLFVTAPPQKAVTGELGVPSSERVMLKELALGKPVILVLNKIDLIKPRTRMLPMLEAYSKVRDFKAVVPVAGRRSDGLDRLSDEIARLLPEGKARWEDDELTDQPVRFFVGEFVREEILRIAREELPYAVAVTCDSFDESGKMPRIHATIHVERDGQKPMILGPGGSRLRDIGTAARERVEALLGTKVYLELFVRVTPGWTENRRLLEEFGVGEQRNPRPLPSADEADEADEQDPP